MNMRSFIRNTLKNIIPDVSFRELFSGTATVLFSKIVGMALSYALIVMISREYGAAVTGAYTLATIFVILFALIGRLGLDTALLRFVSEYSAQNRQDLVRDVYGKALRVIFSASFILSLVLLSCAEFIGRYIFQDPSLAVDIRIISFAVLPVALMLTHAEVLKAQKRNIEFSFLQTIALPLFSICALVVLQQVHRGSNAPAISYLIAAFISVMLAFSRRTAIKGKTDTTGMRSEKKLSEILRVSLPMMASNILIFIMTWIDTIMIGVLRTESEVGVYSTALRIATLANITLFSVASVAASRFVEHYSRSDTPNFTKIVRISSFLNFWISFPIILIIAVAPARLMGLFGDEFEKGAPALLILAAGQFVNTVCGPSGMILQMTGRERLFQKLIAATILLNLLFDLLFIPPYGIIGAAVSSSLALFFWNVTSVIAVKKYHGVWSFHVPLARAYVNWNWNWNLDSALRYDQAVSLIGKIRPQTVVEVGSGERGISAYARYPSHAVDIAFDERVRPGLQKRVIASGANLPFPDDFADMVISTDMLEHVPADQREKVVQELFRVVKPEGLVYIAVPAGENAAQADRRMQSEFQARKGRPHPMLIDHIAHGLPSKQEMVRIVRETARARGWQMTVTESTPIILWENNLLWFGVEKWLRGLRHVQRILLQPLFPILRKFKSGQNYRIIMIAGKAVTSKVTSDRMPSFFVVGAQRSGTTSIHDWLIQQNDILLPRIKETHYFSDDTRNAMGIEWYLSQFPDSTGNKIRGEVDPDYMFYAEAVERITLMAPAPRFIFIFRHPVERAYSHYLMSVNRGFETLSFPDALKAEEERCKRSDKNYRAYYSYMARGRYEDQVKRFIAALPDAPRLYITFDDLFNADTNAETYTSICRFIGIQTTPVLPNLAEKHNRASRPRSIMVRNYLYSDKHISGLFAVIIPWFDIRLRISMLIDRLNQKPLMTKTSDWRSTVPESIWQQADREIKKLERITGLNLESWYHGK